MNVVSKSEFDELGKKLIQILRLLQPEDKSKVEEYNNLVDDINWITSSYDYD